MNINVFYGILIPFIGTSAGAACVFFMKRNLNEQVQRALTGFAAGVMVAASVWSLLIPSIEQSADMGKFSFIPAAVGFWIGVLFLLLLDHMIPHLHQNSDKAEGPKSRLQRTTMLVLAVTLHNIPEGMAVGVVYAGYLTGNTKITVFGRIAHGPDLHVGRAGRDADHHFQRRTEQPSVALDHFDQTAQHDLRGVEIGDHAVFQRAYRLDILMGFAVHLARFFADRHRLAGMLVERHDRRLVHDDFPVADYDRVGRAEVDGQLLCQ